MVSKNFLWLGTVGVASFGLYILLARLYPLSPSLDNPRASWASMVDPAMWNIAPHMAIYLGLTLLYVAVLRILARQQEAGRTQQRQIILLICATWLACSAALMATAPGGESHDIFDYIFRGRMMVEYQANPLVDTPDEFDLSTPFARYLAWRKNVDTYGPVWEASSAIVSTSVREASHWLGWWDQTYPVCPRSPESCCILIAYITGYRLLAIIMTGISGWLILRIVRRNQPSQAAMALAAWLLCPMTLITSALGGHNDFIMLALMILCWWLFQRQRPYLALIALILAAHVKLTALIWLPACILWCVWRWGWKHALKIVLMSTISGLTLSWLLYVPFGGWQSLPRMLHERSEFLANSPWRILKTLLTYQWGWTIKRSDQLSVGLANWLFAIGALLIPAWMFNFRPKRWQGASFNTEEPEPKLWGAMVAVSLFYLVVGSFWFQHWYILWVIAPSALLPNSSFTRSVLPWLVFGALSSNVTMDFLMYSITKASPPLLNYVLSVAIIWGPALLAVSVLALAKLIKRARSTSTLPSMKVADQ